MTTFTAADATAGRRIEAAVGKGVDFTYDRLTVTDEAKDKPFISVV